MNLRSTTTALSALILLVAFLAGGLRAQQTGVQVDSGPETGLMRDQALMALTGNRSDIRKEAYHLLRNQKDFDEIWLAHKGSRVNRATQGWPMTPQLDFDRVQALLLFGGDRTNCNGYRIVEILEDTDSIRVRIDLITYQSDMSTSKPIPRFLDPWALMVLPASKKTLIVEENVQNIKDHYAKWKQVASFPIIKGVDFMDQVPGSERSGD